MLPVSLDFLFLLAPSVFSNVYFHPVSCVPYVASFSGFSFLIVPSVLSNVYAVRQHIDVYEHVCNITLVYKLK